VKKVTPSVIKSEIKELKIQLGESLAERQKSESLLKESDERVTKIMENYSDDIIALTDRNNNLLEGKIKLDEATAEVKVLKEAVAKKDKEIEKITKESAELQAKVDEHQASVNEKEVEAKKLVIGKYVDMKVQFSGLALPENAIALLKHCSDEAEVDTLFEGFREAICEETLHSSEIKEFQVEGEVLSGEALRVFNKVRNVMESF